MSKTVNLDIPMSAVERVARVDANQIVRAFEKNCPNVRMTSDERQELLRLVFIGVGGLQDGFGQ